MTFATRFGVLAALILAPTAQTSGESPREQAPEAPLALFSSLQPGSVPAGFKEHRFPKIKQRTVYELVPSTRGTVLRARSSNSASALIRRVSIDPGRFPWLEWSWKIGGLVEGARWAEKDGDDFAARIFVLFEGKKGPFSFFGGLFMKMAGGLPGRALNYVWAGPDGKGIAPSPYTGQVVMVVQRSGEGGVGQWRHERRNLVEDYRRAFGSRAGTVVGVALMTDTDNTAGQASAWYGDIRLVAGPGERASAAAPLPASQLVSPSP